MKNAGQIRRPVSRPAQSLSNASSKIATVPERSLRPPNHDPRPGGSTYTGRNRARVSGPERPGGSRIPPRRARSCPGELPQSRVALDGLTYPATTVPPNGPQRADPGCCGFMALNPTFGGIGRRPLFRGTSRTSSNGRNIEKQRTLWKAPAGSWPAPTNSGRTITAADTVKSCGNPPPLIIDGLE